MTLGSARNAWRSLYSDVSRRQNRKLALRLRYALESQAPSGGQHRQLFRRGHLLPRHRPAARRAAGVLPTPRMRPDCEERRRHSPCRRPVARLVSIFQSRRRRAWQIRPSPTHTGEQHDQGLRTAFYPTPPTANRQRKAWYGKVFQKSPTSASRSTSAKSATPGAGLLPDDGPARPAARSTGAWKTSRKSARSAGASTPRQEVGGDQGGRTGRPVRQRPGPD